MRIHVCLEISWTRILENLKQKTQWNWKYWKTHKTQNANCDIVRCFFPMNFLVASTQLFFTIQDSEVSHQEEFDMRSCCFNGRTVLFSWLFLHSWWVSMAVATFSQNVTVIQHVWRIYTYIFVYAKYIHAYVVILSYWQYSKIHISCHHLSTYLLLTPWVILTCSSNSATSELEVELLVSLSDSFQPKGDVAFSQKKRTLFCIDISRKSLELAS